MIDKLQRQPLNTDWFSPRQINVLCDIYAKSHGRRNSKAYLAAESDFEARLEPALCPARE
jgi:hypothetical protein